MPGFASILNPGQSVPNDKAIQVYYNTSTSQIGLQLRDKTTPDDDSPVIFHSKDADPTGIIINPSQLTATVMTSVNAIFGFTKQKTDNTGKIDVSLVSPVFERVSTTESTNYTIASSYSKEKAWVYHLSGADENSLKIIQVQVGGGVKSTTLSASDMRLGTSLAAYYDSKKKTNFVIYQHKAGNDGDVRHLYEYKVDSGSSKISNSGDAGKLTSLAAVYHDGKTYLYYTDNDNELRVITKDGEWGSSAAVGDANKVNSSSQITAVSTGDANHIFYTDEDDSPVHLMLSYS
ncbi:hypothetical protein DL770_009083 [Monosporascus sp. CRB-9-2]|nr:hypothetical protein DL770_009083 [Monosporascus sp. CRB-9-2]